MKSLNKITVRCIDVFVLLSGRIFQVPRYKSPIPPRFPLYSADLLTTERFFHYICLCKDLIMFLTISLSIIASMLTLNS